MSIQHAHSVLISCCICGGTVLSKHRHRVVEKIVRPLRALYSTFPGVQESIEVGKEVCCLRFKDNHPARLVSTLFIRSDAQRHTTFVSASRRKRMELRGSRRKASRLAIRLKKRSERKRAPSREKSRRSLDSLPAENPDLKVLEDFGIPACLFPTTDTQGLGALWKAMRDRFESFQDQIDSLQTKLARERSQLTWEWVHDRNDLLKTFTGLTPAQFKRVLIRYQASRSGIGRTDAGMSDEDRLLVTLAWLGRATSFTSISASLVDL